MKFSEMKRGCEIFSKYVGPEEFILGAEHDIIFFTSSAADISAEDLNELESLGFFRSEENSDCWSHFC